jgi:hypothetical protein
VIGHVVSLGVPPCRGPALAAARLMSCWLSFFRGLQRRGCGPVEPFMTRRAALLGQSPAVARASTASRSAAFVLPRPGDSGHMAIAPVPVPALPNDRFQWFHSKARIGRVRKASCVTSSAGPNGDAQLRGSTRAQHSPSVPVMIDFARSRLPTRTSDGLYPGPA